MKQLPILLTAFIFLVIATSCDKETVEPIQETATDEVTLSQSGDNPGLEVILDADYDFANGYYVVSGLAPGGGLDTYYGTTRNWTKQRDNRDVSQIKGTYVATAFADDGTFTNFSIFNGEVTSNGGFTFSNAPRSASGGAKVGDLVEFIDADYDAANGYYVVSGKNASGGVDTYYGRTREWTKQRDNRDVSATKGTYIATAFGDDGNFQNFSIHNGKLNSNGGYTFSGAPRSNSGGAKVGTLVELLSAEYDRANGYYVVSGKNASGGVDTYYGRTRNWTKQRDNRDVSQINGQYITTAFGEGGNFTNFSIFNGKGTSNGGYTFSGAPRSNSGGATIK
ncbi:MAG: hypothetical protein AAGI38_20105 [Bacteroidota bacterium]